MNIALVQPVSFHTWEALSVGYLAAYLKKYGFNSIEFYSGFFDSDEEIISGCKNADIIGFSCTSPQIKHGFELAKKIKNPRNHIVFGGCHASAVPDDTLQQEFIDAVVVGEGEEAFLDIVRGNRDPIVRKPYIQNLDDIPFPDRQIIKQERNLQLSMRNYGKRIGGIFCNRGCPFNCVFCASHSVWSRNCRFRSPENIFEEFEKIVKDLRLDFVTFADDEFGINREQLISFCELKIRKGIKTPWGCNVVASTLTDDLLSAMKKANCTELWIGVESGSPKILKDIGKPNTIENIRIAFKKSKDKGFIRRAYMLLGMPDESFEDIKMSEKLIDEIEPDIVGFTILAPYPGTKFYNPQIHKDIDWSIVDEYQNMLTNTNFLSNEDLRKEQKRLVEKYKKIITVRQRETYV